MLHYEATYGHPCHPLIELEYQVWRAIRTLNYNLNAACEERKLSLNEPEETRRKDHENTRWSKEGAKIFHDKHMYRKQLSLG